MSKLSWAAVFVCIFFSISGCATMHYPKNYKVEGKVAKEFKELDDEKALKLVALIYNAKQEQWEDGIARSIALQEYIGLLKKRNSRYIKRSGIFNIKYEKVNLKKWDNADLVKLYESILPKAEAYYVDTGPELPDIQNTERIMYLTALNAIDVEMKKRDNMNSAIAIGSRILIGVLTTALAMI